MSSTQKGVLTVVMATIITSVMIITVDNTSAKGVEAKEETHLSDSAYHNKTVTPDEATKANSMISSTASENNNSTAGNVTNITTRHAARSDNTLSKETSKVVTGKAASVSSSSLPPPPPGPFFNNQSINEEDKPLSGSSGSRKTLLIKRQAPYLSAKKPLAIEQPLAPKAPLAVEKPTAVQKPAAPKKAEVPQMMMPQSKVINRPQAPQQPAQNVNKKDFKPLMPSINIEKRSVPEKPELQSKSPTLGDAAIKQPQSPVHAKMAAEKRVPPAQIIAPEITQKPVQVNPVMQAPKQMHRVLQEPKPSHMPSRPKVDIQSNNRPSQPARPIQKRHHTQENANQRPTPPELTVSPPSLKRHPGQMHRYVPPNQPNYHFPMMPQWEGGYSNPYPMMPFYDYPARSNGQQNGSYQQDGNRMHKNTTATPVENRKQ